jgi:hypothetical protein
MLKQKNKFTAIHGSLLEFKYLNIEKVHGHGIDNAKSQKFKRFNSKTYFTCAFDGLPKVKRSKERRKVVLHSVQLNA